MGRLPLLAKPGQFYPAVDIIINTKGDITKTKKFCDISLLNDCPLIYFHTRHYILAPNPQSNIHHSYNAYRKSLYSSIHM